MCCHPAGDIQPSPLSHPLCCHPAGDISLVPPFVLPPCRWHPTISPVPPFVLPPCRRHPTISLVPPFVLPPCKWHPTISPVPPFGKTFPGRFSCICWVSGTIYASDCIPYGWIQIHATGTCCWWLSGNPLPSSKSWEARAAVWLSDFTLSRMQDRSGHGVWRLDSMASNWRLV